MNYFEFFELPVSFYLDEDALRKVFLRNSRQYHPDFFTLASEEKQAEVLELSTRNNEAFNTLKDFGRRMRYILEMKGMLADDVKNDIPQSFLMEMMDVNEAIMDLQFDPDPDKSAEILRDMKKMEAALLEDVKPFLESYVENGENEKATLETVRAFYLKQKYLARIGESLGKLNSGL